MSVKTILEKLDLVLGKEDADYLKTNSDRMVSLLEKEIAKNKISADIFLGGSFAKNTLIRSKSYDIDIFIRFDWKYENLSGILEKITKKIAKKGGYKIKKIHGSRDYFRVWKERKAIFEIVPVTRIKKPKEARNVTDLSYFHVGYVKRRMSKKMARETIIAKQFCKAQGIYGAESFINGFSGYGLECLIIYYKSFEKMLKEIAKIKERTIIDPEKLFKKKTDVIFEMNESKLNSPIILVDPTWKERNALAALNWESFRKFQEAATKFLKKPSTSFFEIKEVDKKEIMEEARARKAEFADIWIETDRQPGDIAGTKLKKFGDFAMREMSKYFEIARKEFDYSGGKAADIYIIAKPKKELIKSGPPAKMDMHAKAFRKENKNVFEKSGILHARVRIDFSAKEFLIKFKKDYAKTIREMGITKLEIKN